MAQVQVQVQVQQVKQAKARQIGRRRLEAG
jgi:hypothetical protein